MKKTIFMVFTLLFVSPALYAVDYSQSIVSVDIFGGLGIPWGKIMDKEHDDYSISATWTDGTSQTAHPSHLKLHAGAYIDLTPLRTSFEGGNCLLFGLRSIYTYNSVYQSLDLGGGSHESKSYGGTYLDYQSLTFGPMVSYIFGDMVSNDFVSSFSLDLFLVGGPIVSGTLTPAAAAADYNSSNKRSSTDFSGLKITGGIAATAHFSAFDLGLNMCYSNNMITTKTQVYPSVSKSTSFNEITFDLIFGYHI